MRKLIFIFLALSLAFCACDDDQAAVEKGSADAARRVLVVGTASDYKMKVLEAAIGKLGLTDYYFKIISPAGLASENAPRYGAIVLSSGMVAGRLDGWLNDYLKKNPSDPRTILFITRGSETGKPLTEKQTSGADTVTGASAPERVEQRAEELAGLIRTRFAGAK